MDTEASCHSQSSEFTRVEAKHAYSLSESAISCHANQHQECRNLLCVS